MENNSRILSSIEIDTDTVFVPTECVEVRHDEILDRRLAHGRVRWYSRSLGYGFVREDGDSHEIFVHQSSIQVPGVKRLRTGQRILFERCKTDRGDVAINVIPIMERADSLARYHKRTGIAPAEE